MPQLNGSLELLRIKCSPLGSAHATAISQCCYAAITEARQPLVGSAQAYTCLDGEIM